MKKSTAMLRLSVAILALVGMPACTASLNAGDEGGIAFILFSIMLIVTGAILWVIIGREE